MSSPHDRYVGVELESQCAESAKLKRLYAPT